LTLVTVYDIKDTKHLLENSSEDILEHIDTGSVFMGAQGNFCEMFIQYNRKNYSL